MKGIITQHEKEIIEQLKDDEEVKAFIKEYEYITFKYESAMQETETKLKILSNDYKKTEGHSPIESIETRLKSPESLIKKMIRNSIPFNFEEVQNKLFDIAGVRVVCSFISDIYDIVEMIEKNDDITVVRKKDYVANPKPSGYRSVHLIVKIPIYLTTGREYIFVEIQIRTIAMDFWATLEHKMNYKFDGNVPEYVRRELIECANISNETDTRMMHLNEMVKQANILPDKQIII